MNSYPLTSPVTYSTVPDSSVSTTELEPDVRNLPFGHSLVAQVVVGSQQSAEPVSNRSFICYALDPTVTSAKYCC